MLTSVFSSLYAQGTTYEVNFASINLVNIQLGADCDRTVIYKNLLSGADDIDGDGLVPPEAAFIIEIEDNNPDNGAVVDGCGNWNYTIRPNPDSMVVGFTFGSGVIMASDATPPAQFGTAGAGTGPFFTAELQNLTINTLSSAVSRTFTLNGSSGFPNMSTLDAELMNRLLAGGDIPRFTDACSDVTVTVEDNVRVTGDCDDIVITRTFRAVDESMTCVNTANNPGSGETVVTYDLLLQRPDIFNVQPPAELVTYECSDPAAADRFPEPRPEDYPFFDNPDGPVFLNGVYGNVGASFENTAPIQLCDATIKYVRTYTVIDWCDTDNVRTFSQLVKVGDTGAPTIIDPTQDLNFDGTADDGPLVYSTNAQNCGAFINTNAGGLQITDGCSSVMTVEAFILMAGDSTDTVGPINVNAPNPIDRLSPFLPVGPHVLRYVATDECGNRAVSELDIVVEDRSGPVVIVEDALNVSLSNNGFAILTARDLDEGSYDDCTDIILEITFANPESMMPIGEFGLDITLSCIDVGSVPVIIRATDENGNTNSRTSVINVIDNSAPVCIAPGDLSLDCNEAEEMLPEDVNAFFNSDPNGTTGMLNELFGEPTSLDNCGNEQTSQLVSAEINDCGTGRLTRTFTVTDSRGFASAPGCNQIIAIRGVRNYTVEFPADASASCGNSPAFDDVGYTALGCDMVVTFVETDTFFAASDACFKLRRTIEVINWCEYNGNDPFYTIRRDADQDGNLEESTFLHVMPTDNGTVATLDRDGDRDNGNTIGFLDVDDLVNGDFDSDSDGDTGYNDSGSRGAFRYVQFIKVYDDIAPTITNISTDVTPSTDCNGGGIQIDYNIVDDCIGSDLFTLVELDLDFVAGGGFTTTRVLTDEEVIMDNNGLVTVLLPDLPVGEHAIRVRATDGCGNHNGRIIEFEILEESVVTPICAGRLTFVLAPDGAGGGIAKVEADDYIVSVNNNCANQPIDYSIYREEGEANLTTFLPAPGRVDFKVTCADSDLELAVRIYTFTPSGASSFCNGVAFIDAAPSINCRPEANASLSGFVVSPNDDLLRDIPVHITDLRTMNEMMNTDANGSFLFTPLTEGAEYMVEPRMGQEVDLRRVKTSDITVIAEHALGTRTLSDPYRMIAADANGDGYIDVGDMIAIRRVILGVDLTFDGPSYRFIRRDFDLEGLTEGWDPSIFPTTYTVEELDGHNREADFIAVEIGDVFVQPEGRETRSLVAADALLAAGERTELTLTADRLAGFQGTLEATDGLTIEGWSSELLGAGHVNDRQLHQGLLSFSYDGTEDLSQQAIITLHLRAAAQLRISDYLSVSDRITYREAVAPEGSTASLGLSFSATPGGAGIMLHQNFPNPAAAHTNIVFELPTATDVRLEVRDLQGRLVTERRLAGAAGRNTITLSTNDDLKNTTGILSYTITVGKERLTKRMTVVATR